MYMYVHVSAHSLRNPSAILVRKARYDSIPKLLCRPHQYVGFEVLGGTAVVNCVRSAFDRRLHRSHYRDLLSLSRNKLLVQHIFRPRLQHSAQLLDATHTLLFTTDRHELTSAVWCWVCMPWIIFFQGLRTTLVSASGTCRCSLERPAAPRFLRPHFGRAKEQGKATTCVHVVGRVYLSLW